MMARLKKLKSEWRTLILAGHWPELFNSMVQALSPTSQHAASLTQLQARYSRIFAAEMHNHYSSEQASVENNKLVAAVLDLISLIEETDLGTNTDTAHDAAAPTLEELLADLPLRHPLTPLHLVNCDRQANVRKFNNTFRQWGREAQPTQFYFSLGCHTQEPEGFAERIVLELTARMEESADHPIFYPRTDSGRVPIPKLDFGFTLHDCRERFKKHIGQVFELGHATLEDFLAHTLPKRRESYVVLPFHIFASDWDANPDTAREYLQWLMDTFAARPPGGPVCLFALAITLPDAHNDRASLRRYREVFDDVLALMEGNGQTSVLFHPLPPVERYYVEDWLLKIADLTTTKIDAILDCFCQSLTPAELARYQASEDRLLDMERVEEIQELVYNAARQTR